MKKMFVASLICTFAIISMVSINFKQLSNNDGVLSILLKNVEALTGLENEPYEKDWVENPGPGSNNRRIMPVLCNGEGGWNVRSGCCLGVTSCSFNVCVGKTIKGC